MTMNTNLDLADFHAFIGRRLQSGERTSSPEDALEEWRTLRPPAGELQERVAAIERALEQAQRGEGVKLEEFDRQFRLRHNLPGPQ